MDQTGKRYVREEKGVLTGFLLSAAVISAFVLFTLYNLIGALRSSQANNETLAQMAVLERVLDDMQDIETSCRGYVITGDTAYLSPAKSAFTGIISHLATIRSLNWSVTDTQNVNRLTDLIAMKVTRSREIISTIQHGDQQHAVDLVSAAHDRMLMEQIRKSIAELETTNRVKLKTHSSQQPEIIRNSFIFFTLLSFFLILFLNWTWRRLRREFTKRSQIESEVHEARERILDLYDNAPCGYYCLDANGVITEINKTLAHWLGFPKEALLGKEMSAYVNAAESEGFRSLVQSIIRKRTDGHAETVLTSRDGKLIPVQNTFNVLHDQGLFQVRAAVFDQRAVRDVENQLQSIALMLEYSWDSIISTDMNFKITSWNTGAEKMYGYTKEEAIVKNVLSVAQSSNREDDLELIRDAVIENSFWSGESIHHKKDGSKFPVQIACTLIRNGDKSLRGILSIIKDISSKDLRLEGQQQFNREIERMVVQRTKEALNFVERISDGFIAFDKLHRIIYVNQHAGSLLGLSGNDVIGQQADVILYAVKTDELRQIFIRILQKPQSADFETELDNGQWLYLRFYPSPDGITVFIQDIGERKKFESQLKNSERKYRLLFNNNPLPMWVLNKSDYRFLDVNNAAVIHYGYSREEFLDKTAYDIRDADERSRLMITRRLFPDSEIDRGIWRHLKKDGTPIDVHIYSHDILYDNKIAVLVMAFDMTSQLKAERDLVEFNDELKNLTHHLETVREEERASLAREVHDELGQLLTGLKLDISWIRKKVTGHPEITEKITSAMQLVDLTVATVRKIASSLRPAILDDLGIESAIEWQCIEFARRSGIDCFFDNRVTTHLNIGENAVILLRVCQESLTNISRHAQATRVKVLLESKAEYICLNIEDNGVGFDTEMVMHKGTLGLIGMRERLNNVGGKLEIYSNIGKGTRISGKLPV